VDIEKAVSLLEEDGWVLNGNGRREKDGVVLDLLLVYPEGNNIEPSLQKNLADNLEKAGIGLTMEAVPMDALLSSWYQQSERKADLMYLATNFDLVFDPTVHFGADGSWSYTGCQDTALQEAAEAMRRTDPGDVLNYLRRWVLFQERFNEVLPMLPVYSNRYYDFYTSDLQQYRIAEHITWGEAIVGAELKP
jgi:ABC-type transport system substrate-binding protein